MTLRLFTTPLLAATLLLSTIGCSKKDDPQTQPPSSASYVLDGQARTCQATQTTHSASGYDFLTITLTTTPQPARGPEILYLALRRPTSQPTSAYEYMPVGSMLLQPAGSSQTDKVIHQSPLPTFTSNGVSGTFAGEIWGSMTGGTYTVFHTVKAGTYANVQP
jgi:hypothetical protein